MNSTANKELAKVVLEMRFGVYSLDLGPLPLIMMLHSLDKHLGR